MSNYDKSDQMDDSQFGTTNLIINYLPQSLTDNEFKKIFGGIGPLAQAKIIRNKSNSYSYGFGFVEYLNSHDAEKAIDQLNGLQLKNKRIKVAYSRPHSDDIKRAKLYIKNLSPDTTVEELNQVFSKYGTIIQSNIATNKGIAFILYDRREQAERAIENLQGTTLPGASLPLQIKFASSNGTKNFHNQNNNQNLRQMRPNNNYNNSNYSNNSYPNNNYNNRSLNNANYNRSNRNNNVNNYQYGNNSNYDTQSMENYEHSGNSKYSNDSNLYGGPIRNNQYGNKSHHTNRYNPMNNPSVSSNTPQYDYNDPYTSYSNNSKTPSNDHYSGQSSKNYYHQNNNYGNYGSQNNYQSNYNNNGKNYPNASGGDQPGHIVFVYNIGLNTEEQIYNLFSKFGHVIKCNVIRKNKGFCFVTFSKYENAINAIEKTNNYNLNGNKLQVSFKK